ncbi:hypothetical protein VMCG_01818 [Cytospora schulzeri]|uniref:Phosphoinositide phospholipase C n=1 Tax=Cytospora schulzeri TaxID=448051 RepID=A0A423X2J4_9PEZI|nr:hypothetical protein VMCG_01818 [Valsa malicola]
MSPNRGRGARGAEAGADKDATAGRLRPEPPSSSPTPPGSGGPRPSPKFGAHTAWRHFFSMVALGTAPSPQAPHQQQRQHHHSKSEYTSSLTSPIDDLRAAPFTPNYRSDLPLLREYTHRHIERVFTTLRGREGDFITRERLQEFLTEVQGGLVRPLEKEKYTLGDFIYVWLHDYSAALRPAGKKDLSKPITNYFISSSHNTYIGLGNQLSGEVSAEAYRTVLEGDCRCVEIDVWNGEGSERSRTPTPSRSRSPSGRNNPKYTHKRNLSALSTTSIHSLPAAAQSFANKLDRKWHAFAGSKHKNKPLRAYSSKIGIASASMSQLHLAIPTASYSTTSLENDRLDPSDIGPTLRHVQSTDGRGRGEGGPMSRSRSKSREPRQGRIEPEVTHAHTVQGLGDVGLAKRIPLREVCRVIKESAFKTNKLPLIVSLEVHATGEQQDMMVDIMKQEWGDYLLDEPFADCNPNERQPRLEELMEKILVKVKKPAVLGSGLSKASSQLTVPTTATNDEDGSASDDERLSGEVDTQSGELSQMVKTTSKTTIREALGRLAVYTHSEHYKGFSGLPAQSLSHIFSIDEYKILKLHQSKHAEMFVHNRNFFMRAYPHSTRVSSTNLDPSIYWRKGVQMVALNWQRSHVDEAIMLNSAMFEPEQGWALKPQGYLSSDSTTTQAEAGKHRTLERLRITILAGQHFPFPGESDDSESDAGTVSTASTSDGTSFKPFVKCEIHVETPEERNEKKAIKSGLVQDGQYKLVTKSSETENPDWGVGQVLEFPEIDDVVEELSFVR